MAKLSLSEVSNRFNVSRSTLYRAIKEGRISRSADGLFDIAEVIRCFGEPIKKHEQKQEVNQSKDDADLRQLVDFMKKEIESYKDREKRYLDQIDRFQLLLGSMVMMCIFFLVKSLLCIILIVWKISS